MARPKRSAGHLASTAAIAGHPLHPMIVPFAIGHLIGALLTDLVASFGGDPFRRRVLI
jgi:uncharacterized membrane protein